MQQSTKQLCGVHTVQTYLLLRTYVRPIDLRTYLRVFRLLTWLHFVLYSLSYIVLHTYIQVFNLSYPPDPSTYLRHSFFLLAKVDKVSFNYTFQISRLIMFAVTKNASLTFFSLRKCFVNLVRVLEKTLS